MNNQATYGILSSEETRRIIPPESRLLTDTWLRDTQITVGRDAYYLTGTGRPLPRQGSLDSFAGAAPGPHALGWGQHYARLGEQ